MAEIEDYKRKLREAEVSVCCVCVCVLHVFFIVLCVQRMESDELKKLDDQLLKLQGENASLERNVQSMAEECKEAHKELKELNTQLEVTRTEVQVIGIILCVCVEVWRISILSHSCLNAMQVRSRFWNFPS